MKLSISKFAITASIAAAMAAPAAAQTITSSGEGAGRIIVFGDSLADGGFYGALNPALGPLDSFTTNTDPVTPEVMAAVLGYNLETVYDGTGGTNYAIGGARVALPNPLQVPDFTIPVSGQIANFSAGDSFSSSDIVYIQGGGNDLFNFVAGGSVNPTIITGAATSLAGLAAQIDSAGAGTVVTTNIQAYTLNPASTERIGISLFNNAYEAALANSGANVLFFDNMMLFDEILTNPSSFGFTNVTSPACTPASSLGCGPAGSGAPATYAPGTNLTYLLADTVHPSGGAQLIQGQAIASLFSAQYLPEMVAATTSQSFTHQRRLFEGAQRSGVAEEGKLAVFGNLGYSDFKQTRGLGANVDGLVGNLGLGYNAGDGLSFGVAVAYSDEKGDFAGSSGKIDQSLFSLSGFGRYDAGKFGILGDVSAGNGKVDLSRSIALGPQVRVQGSKMDTNHVAARFAVNYDLMSVGGVDIGPEIGIEYHHTKVQAFIEDGDYSTSVNFGKTSFNSVTGRAGLVASTDSEGPLFFSGRVSYVREFDDAGADFAMRPNGAPSFYQGQYGKRDSDYAEATAMIGGQLSGNISLQAGVSADLFHADHDDLSAFGGIIIGF